MIKEKETQIYLVGFPKSGTSWLIRLIANLLSIPIKNNSAGTESTIEINSRLKLNSKSSFIEKVHLSPLFFSNEVGQNQGKVIYIYRDIKSLVVSAFFYFYIPKRFSFLFLLKKDTTIPFYKNLLRFVFYPIARLMISRFIAKFINEGTGEYKIGTWKNHLLSWRKVLISNGYMAKSAKTFVSYEELSDYPFATLKRILTELNLPEISDEKIVQAIESESFQSMKARLNENSTPTEFSKLRTGKKDDWRNYLTEKNLDMLQEEVQFYNSFHKQVQSANISTKFDL